MSKLLRQCLLSAANAILPEKQRGRTRSCHAMLIDVFLRVLHSGMPWRVVSEVSNVDFRTANRHFLAWARSGIFERAYRSLYDLLKKPTRKFVVADTSFVKNVYGKGTVGPNPTDRGRMATKVLAVTDSRGLPIKYSFSPANKSDHKVFKDVFPLPNSVSGYDLYADKGFDSKEARKNVRSRGLNPRISRRGRKQRHEKRRRVVENLFSWLDKSRRIILRYDSTIVAYKGWTWLASARILANRLSRQIVRQ